MLKSKGKEFLLGKLSKGNELPSGKKVPGNERLSEKKSKGNELPLAEKVSVADVYVHESLQATAANEGLAYSSGQSVVFNVTVPHNNTRSMLVCAVYGYEYVQTQQPPHYTRDVNVLFVRTSKTLVTLDDTTKTDEQSVQVECSLPSVCPSTLESKLLEIGDVIPETHTFSVTGTETDLKTNLIQAVTGGAAEQTGNLIHAVAKRMASAQSALKSKRVSPLQLTSGVRYRCRIGWIDEEHEAELDGAISNGTVHWVPQVGHHNNRGQDFGLDSLEGWELCPGLNDSNRNKNQVALLGLTSPIHFECSGRAYHPIITQTPTKSCFSSCRCCDSSSKQQNKNSGSPEYAVMPTRDEPLVASDVHTNDHALHRSTGIPCYHAVKKAVAVPSLWTYNAFVRVALDRSVLLPGDNFPIHVAQSCKITQVPVGVGGVDTVKLMQLVTIRPSQGTVPSDIPVTYLTEFVLANSAIPRIAKNQPPSIQWASVPLDVLPSMHGSVVHVDHFISLTLLYKNSTGTAEFMFRMPIEVGHLRRKGVKEDGITEPSSQQLIEFNFRKSLLKLRSDEDWLHAYTVNKTPSDEGCCCTCYRECCCCCNPGSCCYKATYCMVDWYIYYNYCAWWRC